MFYGDRLSGGKNGEGILLSDLCRNRGHVFTLSIVCKHTTSKHYSENVEYLGTNEVGNHSGVMDDGKCLRGQLVERPTRVVQQLQSLVASVEEGGCDLQVVHAVDLVCARQTQLKTWCSRDGDRGRQKGQQCGAKGDGEHCELLEGPWPTGADTGSCR